MVGLALAEQLVEIGGAAEGESVAFHFQPLGLIGSDDEQQRRVARAFKSRHSSPRDTDRRLLMADMADCRKIAGGGTAPRPAPIVRT